MRQTGCGINHTHRSATWPLEDMVLCMQMLPKTVCNGGDSNVSAVAEILVFQEVCVRIDV